jgi:low affinity Fe/Cu permease
MNIGWVLFVVLIIVLIGSFPVFPYSANWGYAPSGGVGLIVLVLLILLLTGRI